MPRDEAVRSLRLSQGIFTVVNLGLASYLVHDLAQANQRHVTSSVAISLVAACVSAISVMSAPGAGGLPRKSQKLYAAFAVDWVAAFFNMVALVSLAVFVTKSQYCQVTKCSVAKANTVFTAFNFANWAATATVLGIQTSKLTNKPTEALPVMAKAPN
ncbi:hypothetical protein EJ07DRAFT_124777 [Lizonia empirigonia]|nr:hypothetical protein EJ07DRAFT_124777 [Lizonia empirigonia]